ncbi:MAG: TVP38/TMEM64 family protein [Alphaproteobacteria bacterium]
MAEKQEHAEADANMPAGPNAPAGQQAPAGNDNARGFSFTRLIPLLVLAAGLAAFFAFGLNKYLSFDVLKQHRAAIDGWVTGNGVVAALAFLLGYAVMCAFSLPGGAAATIFGGFLFGTFTAGGLVVVGATIGATGLFLAARTGLGEPLRRRAGPGLERMEAGFRKNALSYLLVLRLVPLFPFWLVNLVPAFLGVNLRTYIIGTFFGIIPGTLVYASIGNGLGSVLDQGKTPDLGIIFRADILIPLVGLAVLVLIPVAYKWYQARKSGGA